MVFSNNTDEVCPLGYRSQIEVIAKAVGIEPRSDQSVESLLQHIYMELLTLRGKLHEISITLEDFKILMRHQ